MEMLPVENHSVNPGIYSISADKYRASQGVCKSMLDMIAKSPAHLKYGIPREETPAMSLGTAAHVAILEAPEFERRYAVSPDCRRGTKEWKTAEEKAAGKIMIKAEEWDLVHRMKESVYRHPVARELLSGGLAEQSLYWTDADTSLLCRARPDYLREDHIIIDLKTTQDAGQEGFSNSCATYRYHCQHAFYLDGYAAITGAVDTFIFIAVESVPPFGVAVYELSPQAVSRGRELYQSNLRLYADCEAANSWPRYSSFIETLELPPYAY